MADYYLVSNCVLITKRAQQSVLRNQLNVSGYEIIIRCLISYRFSLNIKRNAKNLLSG